MKAVILAGGFGTRLSEETDTRPKPMVEIGGRPILWHIMKIYSKYDISEFIICCGYKAEVIKDYFINYSLQMSDLTVDLAKNEVVVHQKNVESWKVTLVDTGPNTLTGGRLLRVRQYLEDEDMFCFTYGDGVGDINIGASIEHHKSQGRLATITSFSPPGRFGAISIDPATQNVVGFSEKPTGDLGLINAGFFILNPGVFDYIDGDDTIWEQDPLSSLAQNGELSAYRHHGFWQPMDTLRDKIKLQELWDTGRAPWKIWD